MARHTVAFERGDEFSQKVTTNALGGFAHVDLAGVTLVCDDADQLEAVGTLIFEAARDLRVVQIGEHEAKSLSQQFDGTDNTAQASAFLREKAARREELRQQREAS